MHLCSTGTSTQVFAVSLELIPLSKEVRACGYLLHATAYDLSICPKHWSNSTAREALAYGNLVKTFEKIALKSMN